MVNRIGKITFDPGADVWPHELKSAQALAIAGYDVHFVKKSEVEGQHTADILIDGESWEIKSPTSDKLKQVEKRLREASKQSSNVVFDSRRMKRLPNHSIQHEVEKQIGLIKVLKRVLYITKQGVVIDLR